MSENGGYGFYKILQWKRKTGKEVLFKSDLVFASVVYYRQEYDKDVGLNVGIESVDNKQVSMPNVGLNVGIDSQNVGIKYDYEARTLLTARQSVILKAVEVKPTHTAKTLSDLIHVVTRTVERELAFLRKNGFIAKQGSKRLELG